MPDEATQEPEYGQFFRTSPDLMSVFDTDGRLVAINPAWHELLGWNIAELETTALVDLVHPDDRAKTLAELVSLSNSEHTSVGFENRQRRSDGAYLWIEWNSQRRESLIYAIGRDITRRKATFEALDVSTEMTRAILDAAADAIIVVNRDLIVVDSSPSTEQIFGYSLGGFGRSIVELVHPDDQGDVSAVILSTFDIDEIHTARFRALHANGHWIEIEARGQALKNTHGDSKLAVFISRDISQEVASRAALAKSLALMQAVVDTAVDVITTIDRDLNVVSTSPASESYTGIPIEERTGRSALEVMHPDDIPSIIAAVKEMFDNGTPISIRYRARGAEGHWLVVESRGRAIDNLGEPPIHAVVITRNVTSTVEMEVALEAAKLEAERANTAKSEFLSRMSHELRTPLNSVLGFAQILQMEIQVDTQLEMVELIYKSGAHLLELINEVLDISRVESSTFEVVLESVDPMILIHGCVELVTPMASTRHITFTVKENEYVNPVVADEKRLNQIFINLFSNAIKYNHEGGSVDVACAVRGDTVRVNVTDTGPGIAPRHLDRLFTPFDRLGAEGTQTEGTGLGLALAKTFAEAMGATMGVRSVEGEGSTFWIDLPIARSMT